LVDGGGQNTYPDHNHIEFHFDEAGIPID